MKTWELVFAALVVVLNLQLHVHGVPQVPCYFIFGDSLADNGNNNLPQTKAKVNYPPYGIDFPNGPTGRFTNGLTMFDMIGFDKLIPSFATANDSDILQGVNYASGAAGIRLEIGKHLVIICSINFLTQQIEDFSVTSKKRPGASGMGPEKGEKAPHP
ncbi:gdsl esterase/lipase [Quercus suber]|uniref:Gdsl esterase/lipase n=1 Tax=Quercus suber TaxID=58331 RepID=A0AAW0LAQ3_QUESU